MTTFKGLLEEADRINQALGLSRKSGSYYSVKGMNGVYCLGLYDQSHSYSQVGNFGPPKYVAAVIRGVLHGIAAAKVWLPGFHPVESNERASARDWIVKCPRCADSILYHGPEPVLCPECQNSNIEVEETS